MENNLKTNGLLIGPSGLNVFGKYLRAVMVIFACIILFATLAQDVSAAAVKNEITAVQLNKSKTDIQIDIALTKEYVKENKSSTLYVFELLPYMSTSQISSLEPVASFKVAEKASVKVSYISGNANRLYSKFVVAEKQGDGSYSVMTSAKYIENLGVLSENTENYPITSSKKGLQIQMFSDAQLLGVQHATINIALNEYLLGENSDTAMSFVYNGQTYYLNKDRIALLDHRVKIYSEAGVNVYFNIVLTSPGDSPNTTINSLYYNTASPDTMLYALNTRSETAMKNYQAFMDYIAARYTRSDHAYGFAPNFIIGFEVNSNRIWNNAGPSDMESRIYSYCTAFRVAYTAMASHYSEGRVYISLGNNFSRAVSDLSAVPDPLYDYPARDFLEFFNIAIKNSGDIPWGLAINPYPSDPTLTEFWTDTYAEDNFSTPFITMKNINVLTRYMNQSELIYDSASRNIIISEFGVAGEPMDEASLNMQAAAYSLAYYAAAQNADIDAFIYHRHVDHSGEGLSYGLWSAIEGAVLEPNAKKPVYNVFANIDTEKSAEVTSFVKTTVGIGAYNLFINDNVKFGIFKTRSVIDAIRADASDYAKGFGDRILFDLTGGSLCGFYPSDSSDYVELRPLDDSSKTMLYARVSGTPYENMGISNLISDNDAFENAQFITLRMMVAAPIEVQSLNVTLRMQGNDKSGSDTVVYSGEAQLTPNEWQDVSFRIKDFISLTDGRVNLLKLWIKTADSQSPDGEYGIWLDNIILHTKSSSSVIFVILWVLLTMILIVLAAYGALYLRANYIRRKRREQMELRRRQQLRMQAMQQNRKINPPPYSQNQNGQKRQDEFK